MKSLIASLLGLAFSPFQHTAVIGTPRYDRSYKRPTPKPANKPVGSKLARKAAEKRLTGNRMSRYGQGLLNQFARTRLAERAGAQA